MNIELNDNLSKLSELSQLKTSQIDNADFLKIEFLIKINNNLKYMARAILGIERSLKDIADSLNILSDKGIVEEIAQRIRK